ncbi:MAG TPA: TA system VapC family ribonuclease toxin [Vicinamibacteria bacterium]|nr:TA system VapC family ribonuclease toxin [Vicinamibacteria bacterium]
MRTALLDLNILTALLWPAHEHHEAAHRWFSARARARWATCSLTQLGFVRIASNPAFSRDALSPAQAVALLAENLARPNHEFWAERLQVPAALEGMEAALQGYRQLTDAYLLALASRRNGVLATFDRGLPALAGKSHGAALEVVPTR